MFGLTTARLWIQAVCWRADTVPLRLTWVSSLFILIGGGNLVAGSLIYSIMTDLTTQEQRASVFLFMNAAVLLSEVVMMPLASAAMKKNPWLPVNIGIVTVARL
ncbi:MFS transporter [Penicillium cf. griseofulvum]|uniref:MFS transporter n=1 Tax=Penicillium cf. griseofulvum TaxID=2972120 RepID=A0A9W9M1D6_9EURO|nr:MFS transporter [Penicillium cf. griseofulvum]KAJ5429709.1 MFS transporter [Penicillium cf. griseofulvum]KAJ5436524.1 MFS transporter [Penicillium cf. griseofulvum]